MTWKDRGETKGSARRMRAALARVAYRRAAYAYDRASGAFDGWMHSAHTDGRALARWRAWVTLASLYDREPQP